MPGTGAAGEPSAAEEAVLTQVAMLVSQALSCLNRGIDGRTCAAAYTDLSGDLAYGSLAGQIKATGVGVVVELSKNLPTLRNQVIAFEQPLKQFIEEFVQGPEDYDEPQERETA